MSFRDSPHYSSVIKAQELMNEDIQKSIELAEIKDKNGQPKGAPNFLIALGLSCYTEYWGKLLQGLPRDKSKECYIVFFRRLGRNYNQNPYEKLIKDNIPVYEDIRCGLVHAYVVDRNCTINLEPSGYAECGICYDAIRDYYIFNIKTYFRDFKNAVCTYLNELENDKGLIIKLNNAIKGKPLLI
jgi:hypothetical protein